MWEKYVDVQNQLAKNLCQNRIGIIVMGMQVRVAAARGLPSFAHRHPSCREGRTCYDRIPPPPPLAPAAVQLGRAVAPRPPSRRATGTPSDRPRSARKQFRSARPRARTKGRAMLCHRPAPRTTFRFGKRPCKRPSPPAKNFFQLFSKTPLRAPARCDKLAAVQRPD